MPQFNVKDIRILAFEDTEAIGQIGRYFEIRLAVAPDSLNATINFALTSLAVVITALATASSKGNSKAVDSKEALFLHVLQ